MIRLLAGQLDRHCDGGVLRDGNDQLWANFLTTLVRYYFALALAPPAHPSRGLALGLATTPMPLLGRMARIRSTKPVLSRRNAMVHVRRHDSDGNEVARAGA